MSGAIGIFDSGLGGLTVLKHLAKEFPSESFCYLGDIARLPYGNKSPETIKLYGEQILRYLKKEKVKALIIACNSASSVFLGRDEFEGIPLLNVIEPGSIHAAQVARNGKVAVLGTSATIRSHAYEKTLKELDPKLSVTEIACPLFVPLVEEGITQDEITTLVIKRYLRPLIDQKIQTVILGCTHYPLLIPDLKKVLGEDLTLIESGEVLGDKIRVLMEQKVIEVGLDKNRQIKLLITDLTDHFERLAHELMGPGAIHSLEKVVV